MGASAQPRAGTMTEQYLHIPQTVITPPNLRVLPHQDPNPKGERTSFAVDVATEHRRVQIRERNGISTDKNREAVIMQLETALVEGSHVRYNEFATYEVVQLADGTWAVEAPGYGLLRDMCDPHGDLAKHWDKERKSGHNLIRHETETAAAIGFDAALTERIAQGDLEDGDMFVWASPPPEVETIRNSDLSDEEKLAVIKQHGEYYDFHSNVSVFTVQKTEQGIHLKTGIIMNHLHPDDLANFVRYLTGGHVELPDNASDIDFLSTIHAIQRGTYRSAGELAERVEEMYENTPEDRKIIPPYEIRDKEQIQPILDEIRPLAAFGFYGLLHLDDVRFTDPLKKQHVLARVQRYAVAYSQLLKHGQLSKDMQEHLEMVTGLSESQMSALSLMAFAHLDSLDDEEREYEYESRRTEIYDTSDLKTACGDAVGASWGTELPFAAVQQSLFGVPTYDGIAAAFDEDPFDPLKMIELRQAREKLRKINFKEESRMNPCPGCKSEATYKLSEVKRTEKIKCGCGLCASDVCTVLTLVQNSRPADTGSHKKAA